MRSWIRFLLSITLLAAGCADGAGPPAGSSSDAGPDAEPTGDPGGMLPPDGEPTCEPEGGGGGVDPSTFPSCDLCGGARCVPNDLVPEEFVDRLADCDAENKCVPDEFVETLGEFAPPTCRSVGGFEGRCLSECLPEVSEQADLLPQANCSEDHLCTPCFDPTTCESTGACDLSCDAPVEGLPSACGGGDTDGGAGGTCPHEGPDLIDPTTLPDCDLCGGGARCVSTSLVPEEQQDLLADCDADTKCVPDDFIRTGGNFVPPTCSSVGGAEGRCLSTCIPQVAEQADLLPQDDCGEFQLCAPCYDPRTGESSGACEVACDMPADPPPDLTCPYDGPDLVDPDLFPSCPMCTDRPAHCLPNDLVPADFADRLADCDASSKCVPDEFIRSTGLSIPDTCRTLGDREGRCMSECLPEIQDQTDFLVPEDCGTGELCAPCYDPLTGENTGACEVACDMPAEPNNPFQECCDGIGTCVPEYLVPEDQQEQVDAEGCTQDDNVLCVPNEFVEDPNFQPTECDAEAVLLGDIGPGRCLPECLPALSGLEGFLLLQGECPDNYKCAPCDDPLSGEPTGACDF